jgi:hypothetical protein
MFLVFLKFFWAFFLGVVGLSDVEGNLTVGEKMSE